MSIPRWIDRTYSPILDRQQVERIAMHMEEYESNGLEAVCCEFGRTIWEQSLAVFLWEDEGEEFYEAYWLLDDGTMPLVTGEDDAEYEAILVANFPELSQ